MYREIKIENKHLSAIICTLGAEFKSIKKDGRELLWDGDPDVWAGQAPILFPICGALRDDKYIYEEKEYYLEKHGFARTSEFEVEKADETSVVLLLKPSKETQKKYPFDYEFRACFTLEEASVRVDYNVLNLDTRTMYYSVGAHEAYACPEGVGNYSIIFDGKKTLGTNRLNRNLLGYESTPIIDQTNELLLKDEYFEEDALIFPNVGSERVGLRNNTTGEMIEVSFAGAEHLLIWTKPNAKYICIEPWCGLPDFVDSDCILEHKKGICALPSGKERIHTHIISF